MVIIFPFWPSHFFSFYPGLHKTEWWERWLLSVSIVSLRVALKNPDGSFPALRDAAADVILYKSLGNLWTKKILRMHFSHSTWNTDLQGWLTLQGDTEVGTSEPDGNSGVSEHLGFWAWPEQGLQLDSHVWAHCGCCVGGVSWLAVLQECPFRGQYCKTKRDCRQRKWCGLRLCTGIRSPGEIWRGAFLVLFQRQTASQQLPS